MTPKGEKSIQSCIQRQKDFDGKSSAAYKKQQNKMDTYNYFQTPLGLVIPDYDGGASDGVVENYSSGDSSHSGDISRGFRPYSSLSSNSEGGGGSRETQFFSTGITHRESSVFNGDGAFGNGPFFNGFPQGMKAGGMGLEKRQVGYNRPRVVRNMTVTSPSPSQVSSIIKPFLNIGPPSPWQVQGGGKRRGSVSLPRNDQFDFPFQQPDSYLPGNLYQDDLMVSPHFYPDRPGSRQMPHYCDHPECQLGDDVGDDVIMARQNSVMSRPPVSNRQQNRRPNSGNNMEDSRDQEPCLKYRLGLVRAMIREEQAQRAAADEARGVYPSSRRERRSKKKCKFCLKKKEPADIVGHHNVMNDKGDVTCPILQQYRCDVCHATGKKAHTIKYCPLNNPSIPHEIILHARWQVHQRNKQRDLQ
ncbi:hypothetical protein ACOMHN_065624 [Nucella lapillus]